MQVRPKTLKSKTTKYELGCGDMYITVAYHDSLPVEVFITKGHSGFCGSCIGEAFGRLCSIVLRGGIKKEVMIEQLKDVKCDNGCWESGVYNASCVDAIMKALSYGQY